MYNSAVRNLIKKYRENPAVDEVSDKHFQMNPSPLPPPPPPPPVAQQQQQYPAENVEQYPSTPQTFTPLNYSYTTPPGFEGVQLTDQTQQSVASTPRKRRTPLSKDKQSTKTTKKSVNSQIVDEIAEHVMANRNIYPVNSNEQIVSKDNQVIPKSNLKESIKRYLDAKPGEHTPPGTNRVSSILKADPKVVDHKRSFKPENWKKYL
uniref:Uncharacterized protein n=1 Tax=Panagrolaimus davidi TaxID=227884 RepID=A0A914QIJ6_9BILA